MVEVAVKCYVCLDDFKEYPVTLKCDHMFDAFCLKRVIDNAQTDNQTPRCPLCRDPIKSAFCKASFLSQSIELDYKQLSELANIVSDSIQPNQSKNSTLNPFNSELSKHWNSLKLTAKTKILNYINQFIEFKNKHSYWSIEECHTKFHGSKFSIILVENNDRRITHTFIHKLKLGKSSLTLEQLDSLINWNPYKNEGNLLNYVNSCPIL